ncbi:hypothetical protein DAQ1742_03597 [Dickeya aquatica]|uniref:Uncharacterized protein n=1 Tax=Dickeya aquatica TaxID=1401087 RepID=A0A375AE72_9GAMM|nr:hypothetical protein DAQ1742_03597 [Dickeya aquatica]
MAQGLAGVIITVARVGNAFCLYSMRKTAQMLCGFLLSYHPD